MVRDDVSTWRYLLGWGSAASLAVAAVAIGSTAGPGVPRVEPLKDLDVAALRTGDLVFRAGRGWRAGAVRAASGSSLTHVGIVDRDIHGRISVIHADPPEGGRTGMVRRVPLAAFADPADADRVVAYRLDEAPGVLISMVASARRYAAQRVPFDDAFDLASPDAVYCTELVWRALAEAGERLVPRLTRIDAPVVGGTYMTPEDLLHMERSGKAAGIEQPAGLGSVL